MSLTTALAEGSSSKRLRHLQIDATTMFGRNRSIGMGDSSFSLSPSSEPCEMTRNGNASANETLAGRDEYAGSASRTCESVMRTSLHLSRRKVVTHSAAASPSSADSHRSSHTRAWTIFSSAPSGGANGMTRSSISGAESRSRSGAPAGSSAVRMSAIRGNDR